MTTTNDEMETGWEKKQSCELFCLLLSSSRGNYRFLLYFTLLMTNPEHAFICLRTSFSFLILFFFYNNTNRIYCSMHRLMSRPFISRVLHLNSLSSRNIHTYIVEKITHYRIYFCMSMIEEQ
jgi:hypothetical protein